MYFLPRSSFLSNRQLARMQLCGSCYNIQYLEFVCVDQMGMLLQPDFGSLKFRRILAKYGLRPIRFRDRRHTFVTIALQNGEGSKTVSGMLGDFSARM